MGRVKFEQVRHRPPTPLAAPRELYAFLVDREANPVSAVDEPLGFLGHGTSAQLVGPLVPYQGGLFFAISPARWSLSFTRRRTALGEGIPSGPGGGPGRWREGGPGGGGRKLSGAASLLNSSSNARSESARLSSARRVARSVSLRRVDSDRG